MSTDKQLPPPPVKWAQNRNLVFVTFCLDGCKKPTVTVDSDKIYFKGFNETDKKDYEVTINLYDEIDSEKSLKNDKGRHYELSLKKKNTDASFWPTLNKEGKKYHWLTCDFNKWKDEDDTDSEKEDYGDFQKVMQNMERESGYTMDRPDFGEEFDEPDSDDDKDIPDLQ